MSHHRRETNPHFIRLQSQDRVLGSPPNPRGPAPHRSDEANQPDGAPLSPHGRRPDQASPPVVQVRPRGQHPAPPPTGQQDGRRVPRGQHRRPLLPGPDESPPRYGGQVHGPLSTRPVPLNPEERQPPHRSPPSAKPLPLSPSGPLPSEAHPGHRHHRPHHSHDGPRIPPAKKTNPLIWSLAAFCAIFWVIIILGGLIVLIVYLLYRPHSPHFDITSASLNAAYLDMGFLLNADLTVLANFTNPSRKGSIKFSYVTFELYYYNTLIATQYIEPFSATKAQSMFANVHLVSSQVRLPPAQIQELKRQIDSNGVTFDVRGTFHARSNLGSLLRYSYWLYSHCTILVSGPPIGVLRARRCNTKR